MEVSESPAESVRARVKDEWSGVDWVDKVE
jgi:hypothetical protein